MHSIRPPVNCTHVLYPHNVCWDVMHWPLTRPTSTRPLHRGPLPLKNFCVMSIVVSLFGVHRGGGLRQDAVCGGAGCTMGA